METTPFGYRKVGEGKERNLEVDEEQAKVVHFIYQSFLRDVPLVIIKEQLRKLGLDQTIANFYKKEVQLSTLYKIFAGVAIFISCLGLYGLVSFMAVQRTKEVVYGRPWELRSGISYICSLKNSPC